MCDNENVICIGKEFGKENILSIIRGYIEDKYINGLIDVVGAEDVDTEYGVLTVYYEIELEHEDEHFDSDTLHTIMPSYDKVDRINIFSIQ